MQIIHKRFCRFFFSNPRPLNTCLDRRNVARCRLLHCLPVALRRIIQTTGKLKTRSSGCLHTDARSCTPRIAPHNPGTAASCANLLKFCDIMPIDGKACICPLAVFTSPALYSSQLFCTQNKICTPESPTCHTSQFSVTPGDPTLRSQVIRR
jgi:hypothetical protein